MLKVTVTMTFSFHFFLFFVDSDIRVATASAVLLVSSFMAAKILIHFYHPLQNMTSGEAVSPRCTFHAELT